MLVSKTKSLFTATLKVHNFSSFSKIHSRNRPKAIKAAQQAVTDYLHLTKSVPYAFAEQISQNAQVSLSNLVSNVNFSTSDYMKFIRKKLRYDPINEFEFFFESIGIDYSEVNEFLPSNKFFFSEDEIVVNNAFLLSAFGFPWNKLGLIFKEERSVFYKSESELSEMLCRFKSFGFDNTSVTGICLAFPHVLSGELRGDIEALFSDLKRIFVDFDVRSFVEENVDSWFEFCRKIRVFYDLGCEKGKIGDLIGERKNIFLDVKLEDLFKCVEYFCRFGVRKKEVGLLLLQRPELLNFDLETPMFSVLGLLRHFGMSFKNLESVAQLYPHVLGRNKMANLPHVMRSINQHTWFFTRLRDGNHKLLASYIIDEDDDNVDKVFKGRLEMIQNSRTPHHTMNKLNFMHEIGFGENALTVKILDHLHGSSSELQERFDCLVRAGIPFSNLCLMIRTTPKIMNQQPEILERKIKFLCHDMGLSLRELDIFPAFLCFNLDDRIKPRFQFHVWLAQKGLAINKYSVSSIVATSERNFINRLRGIHPAAPKHWLEFISSRSPIYDCAIVHLFS